MSTRTVDRAADWDTVSFSGGYAGLHGLADAEFSGMVTAGPARLFMLQGSVVGVLDGDVEDFEDAGGTAREAPHPALPLLAVMQERADEVRAQYYTEETPISEVDRTLADGNFTGFIELSENVLSGDYYQVYHQGRSMSVAFVGASEQLIVDDEAFEQADDEVGIYEVKPVDIDIVEIPEPESGGAGTDAAAATAATEGADAGVVDDAEADQAEETPPADHPAAGGDDAGSESQSADDASAAAEPEPSVGVGDDTASADATDADDAVGEGTDSPEQTGAEPEPAEEQTGADPEPAEEQMAEEQTSEASSTDAGTTTADAGTAASGRGADAAASTEDRQSGGTAEAATTEQPGGSGSPSASRSGGSQSAPDRTDRTQPQRGGSTQQDGQGSTHPAGGADGSSGASLAAEDLELRSLPSLDPAKTAAASRDERAGPTAPPAPEDGTAAAGGQAEAVDRAESDSTSGTAATPEESGQPSTAEPATEPAPEPQSTAEQAAADSEPSAAEPSAAEPSAAESEDLAAAREEVQRLEDELAELEGEHEAVVAERDRLQEELAEAREEIERLQGRLEEVGAGTEVSTSLSPREAIDETNLFIRYDSKGEATLEKAHDDEADREAVDANMRVEYHTSFDADDAAVDGIDFDTFLTDTIQYDFVDWLVRQLLYEIRDTGNTGPMGDLYDAIPKIDRAELNGQVGVEYTEDGQEHRGQIAFDVIVRDRMGNPLMVANLNDSRDPATESMMTDLVRAAERVGESSPSLAGAFLVTRSFFEPEALETAEEATAGGLLNRGKQKSFVNLSRKGGYHLCLVEARNQEFHLAVPEL